MIRHPVLRTTVVVVAAVVLTPWCALSFYLLAWRLPVVTPGWVAVCALTVAAVACLAVAWVRRHRGDWWWWGQWPVAAAVLVAVSFAALDQLPKVPGRMP